MKTSEKRKTMPAQAGWHMPAEWQPHEATWIAWPHNRSDWPGKFAPISWVFADIVRHLTQCEFVHLLVNDEAGRHKAERYLRKVHVDLTKVRFFRFGTNRVWTRDYGPTFLTSTTGTAAAPVLLGWHFNSWAKYDDWQLDSTVPRKIAKALRAQCVQPLWNNRRIVLEGGSIDVNGQGLLLTTEECLLSNVQERNPGMTRQDYEQVFADYLGVNKVIWLNRGIAGDDTHGHIDDLARFVGPRTLVTVVEENSDDENYRPLQENLERLQGMTDQRGGKLDIVKLPMPHPVMFEGRRLPASYANFYIANDRVLAPTFNDPNDRIALGVLAELFLEKQVVGIHALDLVWGLGTLHCMTQQQPLGS